jgi:tRNA(Arg) A34 adenosine deaminase TadA
MKEPSDPSPLDDDSLLRRAFEVARRSRRQGDHPFGALLAGPDGTVLIEQCNGFTAEGHDMTAHAERLIATRASRAYGAAYLAGCTIYSSPARSTGPASAGWCTAKLKKA